MKISLDDEKKVWIRSALRSWYDANRRTLPWREEPEPYRVWVSEIMLQQTRVSVVIPYFERWMERFPTIADLARADQDDVLAMWSGLGYYRRARMLHQAAQEIVAQWGGELPGTVRDLLKIPGIGKYTAGAIASIAFGVSAPIVDGNVVRILSRWFALDADVSASSTQKVLWSLAEELVPDEEPGEFNQAMMELGAMMCVPKKPMCLLCPLASVCEARAQGLEDVLPRPKVKAKKRPMFVASVVVRDEAGAYAVVQRPQEGLFGGLWEFPSVEIGGERKPSRKQARGVLVGWLGSCGVDVALEKEAGDVKHLLSHIRLTHLPWTGVLRSAYDGEVWDGRPVRWVTREGLDGLGLSSVMRKVLEEADRVGG